MFRRFLENLRETLIKELDFRNEAEAMKFFKANNRAVACLGVPEVYDSFYDATPS